MAPVEQQVLKHVAPPDHPAFYSSGRFALNLARNEMISAGYSPSLEKSSLQPAAELHSSCRLAVGRLRSGRLYNLRGGAETMSLTMKVQPASLFH